MNVTMAFNVFSMQATGNISEHFTSSIMEPRVVVFIDSGDLSQMIIVAENQELFEVPGDTLLNGILHLMATYYVYNVAYPKSCRSLLFFSGHFIEQA